MLIALTYCISSVLFWRCFWVLTLLLGYFHKQQLDASLRHVYSSYLIDSPLKYDSAEPILVVIAFYASTAWFNGLEVCFPRWVQQFKVQPNTVPCIKPSLRRLKSSLGIWKAVVYLTPIVAYDVLFPRKVLSTSCPGAFEMMFSVVCCLFWYDALFTIVHLVLHSSPTICDKVHGKHHRNARVQAYDTLELSFVEAASEVGCSILALNICNAHYLTRAVFDVVIVYLLVELHSGFDAPWQVSNVIPWKLWGGSREHYIHHVSGNSHFQKYFTYADKLFGTYGMQRGGKL